MIDNKPKLSNSMKDELKKETRLTLGKMMWPILSLIFLIVVALFLTQVYLSEQEKVSEGGIKTPDEKIENKPDVSQDEIDELKEEEEEAKKKEEEAKKKKEEPTPEPDPEPKSQSTEYTIVEGDTLGAISEANDISLATLLAANSGITPESIQIGQKIKIPVQ